MAQPVVSSRYGRRPILDIPPMLMTNQLHLEVPSLETPGHHYTVPQPKADNPMLGPGVYTGMPATVPAPAINWPHPGYDRRYHTAPHGGYTYGPQMYPGVGNPYNYPVPPPMPRVVSDPGFAPNHPGFNIKCDLEYGRIVNINVRDSQGAFRGIPPFLRDELVRTYGRYPYTQVKVRMERGEFHIYASTHHKSKRNDGYDRREEEDGDTYYEAHSDRFRDRTNGYDSESDGIRPRDARARPRGINHEEGWNSYR